jgi:hypothetical protein
MTEPCDLAAIKARCDAATSGPLEMVGDTLCDWNDGHPTMQFVASRSKDWPQKQVQADGEFFIHSRTDVPAMHDEIVTLRKGRRGPRPADCGVGKSSHKVSGSHSTSILGT